MARVLIIVALALGAAAGLDGCGGSPLGVTGGRAGAGGRPGVGGRAGTGDEATAGGTAGAIAPPDAPVEHAADAAPDVAGADAAVERADARPDADAAAFADARDGSAGEPGDASGATDVSGADVKARETAPSGWLAFDVTSTIVISPPASEAATWAGFPTTARFPMAWSPAGAAVIVGEAAYSPVDPNGAGFNTEFRTFAYIPFAASCEGTASLDFDTLTFFIGSDGQLHGTASGDVRYQMGDTLVQTTATFSLTGGPDVTPPTISPLSATTDPLAPVSIEVTEPMAPGGSMALVGTTSGDRIPLEAFLVGGDSTPLGGFDAPQEMLRWGEVYKIETAGVTDLAGNAIVFATPPTRTTPPAPPLQAEDGFEAVTGTTFAGAGVLKGGPLAPIAGTTSLLMGNVATFGPYQVGTTSMTLRLAVKPGDTVVRFDRRLVSPIQPPDPAYRGGFLVGVVGKPIQSDADILDDSFTQVSAGAVGVVWESAVGTTTLPLPDGAAGEVSFEIVEEPTACGVPPPPMVMIIDNLRVE
jgi:hypothetical protein